MITTDQIYNILCQAGYSPKDIGSEWQMTPLYRDSDNATALCVNKRTGVWYDFVSKESGTIETLVEKTLNGGTPNQNILDLLKFNPSVEKVKVELEQQTKFSKDLLLKLKKDYSYWEARGISKWTAEYLGGGIAEHGRMANRWTFPVFNHKNGDLVGFSGRYLKQSKYCPKWKILGQKKSWVYPAYLNALIIKEKREVILVESIGNALSLLEVGIKNFIVLFGIKINPEILCFLLASDTQKINIILDNDEEKNSVGNRAAEDMKRSLLNFFDESQINNIVLPEKDLNDMLVKDRVGFEEFCKTI